MNNNDIIEYENAHGETVSQTRDEFVQGLLEDAQEFKNQPEALFNIIRFAFDHGIIDEILPVVEHLYAIDTNALRKTITYAEAYQHQGLMLEAAALLATYEQKYGTDPQIFMSRASIHVLEQDISGAFEVLDKALALYPNDSNVLNCYCALLRDSSGAEAEFSLLNKLAEHEHTWLAKWWLGDNYLLSGEFDKALALFHQVISIEPNHPEVLKGLADSLMTAGHPRQTIHLIYPNYRPEEHELDVGYHLLNACMDSNNAVLGKKLLKRLFVLTLPDEDRESLLKYDYAFDQMEQGVDPMAELGEHGEPTTIHNYSPLWFEMIGRPSFLMNYDQRSRRGVLFAPLAVDYGNTPKSDVGKLSRGLTLHMAERLFLNTNLTVHHMHSADQTDLVVTTSAMTKQDVQSFKSADMNEFSIDSEQYLVTGVIKVIEESSLITIHIWDLKTDTVVNEKSWRMYIDNQDATLKSIVNHSVKTVLELMNVSESVSLDYFRPQHLGTFKDYCAIQSTLMKIERAFIMKLPLNGVRHAIEVLIKGAEKQAENELLKMMMLAGLYQLKYMGILILSEYKDRVMKFIPEILDMSRTFDRLVILLYVTFDMEDTLIAFKEKYTDNSDDAYHTWLAKL